jgi:hypothetical protein
MDTAGDVVGDGGANAALVAPLVSPLAFTAGSSQHLLPQHWPPLGPEAMPLALVIAPAVVRLPA